MAEMSEKPSEESEMSELVWASSTLRKHVAPPGSAAGKMERIRNAATALRWKFSRTKHVWYADPTVSLKPREIRKIEEVSGVLYGRQEVDAIDQLISRADALLEGPHADFYSAFVAALRAVARAPHRPGTEG